jgi:hypothetical protein
LRLNNFENTTNILAKATISNVNNQNNIQILQYRLKEIISLTWSEWNDISNNT